MQSNETFAPFTWLQHLATALQWPAIVAFAFGIGRYTKSLEHRLNKAETNITALIERHMPAIHSALAEIRGLVSRR